MFFHHFDASFHPMDNDDETMFTCRVPMNSARTWFQSISQTSSSSNRQRSQMNSIKYIDGSDLIGSNFNPSSFERFPMKKRTRKSFHSTSERKWNVFDRSLSLIPLDECLIESSSDLQSLTLPAIHSKYEFDEILPSQSPWIRRFKSIHQSQRLNELFLMKRIPTRISYSRQ